MIERYEKKEISNIWTDHYKFKKFLDVEVALLKSLEKRDITASSHSDLSKKFSKAKINTKRIEEIEKETRHDVIAFCTSITEQFPAEQGRFFHYGVTSSDIIDTALSLQIRESLSIILRSYKKLIKTLEKKSEEYKDQLCMGRSHGIYAEPMSFGVKLLGHTAEFKRRYNDLNDFYQNELTGQISGAVGNYTIITPEIEEEVLSELGLKVEPVSTQVIPRDRIAKLISIFSLFSCALERIAVEIRHLQHSDVSEVFEGFSKGQKGSSTMPHKKNPISSENLTGMARLLRSHMSLALDNCLLWHERDISHSSNERMYLPDSLGIMLYSIERLDSTISNLVVDSHVMEEKVNSNFKHLSSYFLHELIQISKRSREELYKIVQTASFEALTIDDFYAIIEKNLETDEEKNSFQDLKVLSQEDIFSKHNDAIFNRV